MRRWFQRLPVGAGRSGRVSWSPGPLHLAADEELLGHLLDAYLELGRDPGRQPGVSPGNPGSAVM
jgi:hypothetical protein